VVPKPGVDAGDIAAFLGGQLAHYKQPQGIEFVETIPKSASGKILRRILKDTYGKAGRS
jgi:acyl-coenzyme A synthetase/AMP-(fatty) acid ligase